MKLFQKSALAVAIAAVPFLSVNAMEALDDAALSEMTGQAGVTIETQVDAVGIRIGSIEYTDTLGAAGDIGGGSLVIGGDLGGDAAGYGIQVNGVAKDQVNGEWVGQANVTQQKIDIDEGGNLITESKNLTGNYQQIRVANVGLRANGAATTGASLVSNLNMVMENGDSSAHIINLGNIDRAASETWSDAYSGSLSGEAAVVAGLNKADAAGAKIAIATKSSSKIVDLSVDALEGAVGIRGMTYDNGSGGVIESTQVIWAIGGPATENDFSTGGVYIQGSDSKATLNIGELRLAGQNIGSIKISNINQAGSVTRIYGH